MTQSEPKPEPVPELAIDQIVDRVLAELKRRRRATLRWVFGLFTPLLGAVLAALLQIYINIVIDGMRTMVADEVREGVAEEVREDVARRDSRVGYILSAEPFDDAEPLQTG